MGIDFGIGTFVVHNREATFDFTAGNGPRVPREISGPCADPMLGARLSSEQAAGIQLSGFGAGAGCASGGNSKGGSELARLHDDEEDKLFAEVDMLDPESRTVNGSEMMGDLDLE